jgi:hypothetical protein
VSSDVEKDDVFANYLVAIESENIADLHRGPSLVANMCCPKYQPSRSVRLKPHHAGSVLG